MHKSWLLWNVKILYWADFLHLGTFQKKTNVITILQLIPENLFGTAKVVSTGFGVPVFHAVGIPIGTKYTFSGGLTMGAYKDKVCRWYVSVRYKNWLGEPSRKTKRGFTTKRDSLEWEREFLQKYSVSLDTTFNSFSEVFRNDLQNRIRHSHISCWLIWASPLLLSQTVWDMKVLI